jgi:hypothetical protein
VAPLIVIDPQPRSIEETFEPGATVDPLYEIGRQTVADAGLILRVCRRCPAGAPSARRSRVLAQGRSSATEGGTA